VGREVGELVKVGSVRHPQHTLGGIAYEPGRQDHRQTACLVWQIAQEKVLGNVDDRGVATIDSGHGVGCAG
jgi:hypothetical protein